MRVIPIATARPSAALVETLEYLLSEAKSGNITSIAFIARGRSSAMSGNGWTEGFIDNPAESLGWLEYMKQRVLKCMSFVEDES